MDLCKKYNFWRDVNLKPLPEQHIKPLSWITKENFLYKLELCDNLHKQQKNQDSFQKIMPKISEEGSSIGNSCEIHNKNEKIINSSKVLEIKHNIIEKSNENLEKKNEIKEKENFIEYFSKKIEDNLNEFFILPKNKKSMPLHSSQKKNLVVIPASNQKLSKKNNNFMKDESFSPPQQINFKLNFESISNKKKENSSFSSELQEIKNLSFEKFSGFFSDEKDKFFGLSFQKPKVFEEIENMRNFANKIQTESPKRRIDCTLNLDCSFNDNAFLLDSNEKNLSKDDLFHLLDLIEEKNTEKVNLN